MTPPKAFHAVADDTALVANISEIKKWVAQGALTLVIPVYTLDRLHLLKRDSSQIGINAREATKFLDRVTSGKDNLPEDSVHVQGPTEIFPTWDEVEKYLTRSRAASIKENPAKLTRSTLPDEEDTPEINRNAQALSQALLDKLNFAKEPETPSNASTPPTSPSSSNAQSAKASPELNTARPAKTTKFPAVAESANSVVVSHTHRPLINSAVYLLNMQMGESTTLRETFMLTNDHETAIIARKFGLNVKNIYQLRSAITSESQEAKNQSRYQQRHSPKPSLGTPEMKPKTLFNYDDDEGDDDEVVFRPRPGRGGASSRGRLVSAKTTNENRRSAEVPATLPIPTEEIDPDSFDRGAFGRTRPVTPTNANPVNGLQSRPNGRGSHRGPFGGHNVNRGSGRGMHRGFDRGSSRGKGKLFIP
ncbi:hypothetical protein UCRPC4_g05185 [Phaeomoniella chlamydospora]|uniref:PIN domain-containing protein n=1 Tax=Phaeomoniella chlamydospora TaxID=158046 RepID=A0A0G2E4N9_PHACM|nr:hypothetical protein UCRPC4_g05185 [Phaeomoniella chlamydospora]